MSKSSTKIVEEALWEATLNSTRLWACPVSHYGTFSAATGEPKVAQCDPKGIPKLSFFAIKAT